CCTRLRQTWTTRRSIHAGAKLGSRRSQTKGRCRRTRSMALNTTWRRLTRSSATRPSSSSTRPRPRAGKDLGGTTCKVHLDGYNQLDFITGKSPSNRNEIFYFAETTLGAVRIGDFKYRFIDQPEGWLGNTVKVDWPILTNIRLDPFE